MGREDIQESLNMAEEEQFKKNEKNKAKLFKDLKQARESANTSERALFSRALGAFSSQNIGEFAKLMKPFGLRYRATSYLDQNLSEMAGYVGYFIISDDKNIADTVTDEKAIYMRDAETNIIYSQQTIVQKPKKREIKANQRFAKPTLLEASKAKHYGGYTEVILASIEPKMVSGFFIKEADNKAEYLRVLELREFARIYEFQELPIIGISKYGGKFKRRDDIEKMSFLSTLIEVINEMEKVEDKKIRIKCTLIAFLGSEAPLKTDKRFEHIYIENERVRNYYENMIEKLKVGVGEDLVNECVEEVDKHIKKELPLQKHEKEMRDIFKAIEKKIDPVAYEKTENKAEKTISKKFMSVDGKEYLFRLTTEGHSRGWIFQTPKNIKPFVEIFVLDQEHPGQKRKLSDEEIVALCKSIDNQESFLLDETGRLALCFLQDLKESVSKLPSRYADLERGLLKTHKRDMESLAEDINTNARDHTDCIRKLEAYYMDAYNKWATKQRQAQNWMFLFFSSKKQPEPTLQLFADFLNEEKNHHHATRLVGDILSHAYSEARNSKIDILTEQSVDIANSLQTLPHSCIKNAIFG